MSDTTPNNQQTPGDDLPNEKLQEDQDYGGPLDSPQEGIGNDFQALADQMLARQSVALRHFIPDTEQQERQPAHQELLEAMGEPTQPVKGESIMQRRWRRFKSLKRGYYAFLMFVILYPLSFALPLLVNNKALIVNYDGEYYFPVFSYYPASTFGDGATIGEIDYRKLDAQLEADGSGNWALMPLYTWDPYENDFEVDEPLPLRPSARHWLGTDNTGRDVFARMCYGFNISISFAILLTLINYMIGALLGGLMGYYGGKFDLVSQRVVEVWSNIPFLYTVIIVSSILIPNFAILILILALFGWISISYYMRGEFLREKAKDYVAAAIALGVKDKSIIIRHILPNSLTPIIAFFPFALVGGITVLVSLDYLGFGLPPPTPSWGQMVSVGLGDISSWWLVVTPLSAMFLTLLLVTFIGEALREAFDPKVFSRLR